MAWNKNVNTNAPSNSVIANLLKASVAISSCAILFACGDDVTNETITQIVQDNAAVVNDVSELPNCTPENEGKQAFIRGENASRICVDGVWFASFANNSDKADEFKCVAEPLIDGSGLKILCNGDSIGVVLNGSSGVNGAQGIQGEKGDKGFDGANGKSAYEIAKAGGYTGTEEEWLVSLKGADGTNGTNGKSAYEIARDGGYTGTEAEWLESLKGANGKSAYEIAKAGGYTGTEEEWLESLKGADGTNGTNGKSAYEIAKDGGYTGTEEEWLESLKGEKGNSGADACSVDRVGEVITIDCGEKKVSFTGEFVYGRLTDERDSKTYKTVVIGEQTWMAENLNYYDTIAMPALKERSACYDGNPVNCAVLGRLYAWSTAMDSSGSFSLNSKGCSYGRKCTPTYPVRGICPEGWHLPTKEDFQTLFTTVGGQDIAGMMLKAVNRWQTEDKYDPVTHTYSRQMDMASTDAYGFSAIPSSYYSHNIERNEYIFFGNYTVACFWSSSQPDKNHVVVMELYGEKNDAYLRSDNVGSGVKYDDFISIRCLKDSE